MKIKVAENQKISPLEQQSSTVPLKLAMLKGCSGPTVILKMCDYFLF